MANMGTKPETGPDLLRNSSLCMGHIDFMDLPVDQHATLIVPYPISYYNHFGRENI